MMCKRLLLVGLALVAQGCGGWGSDDVAIARYFGELTAWQAGQTPRALPPIRDRQGNAYLAMQASADTGCTLDINDVYVGKAAGGWTSGCPDATVRKPSMPDVKVRGVHGWVGFGDSDAFLFGGDSLVRVTGAYGECKKVLNTDPTTRADLHFLAVVPWLWDHPSLRTVDALLTSPTDERPYHVLVDVDRQLYAEIHEFQPATASNVVSLGAGGNLGALIGVMFVWYVDSADQVGHVVAIFLDENDHETGRTEITDLAGSSDPTSAGTWWDAIVGLAATASSGQTVALLSGNQLVSVTPTGSRVTTVSTMTAQGVQLWNDQLWLVGVDTSGLPVLARIAGDGSIAEPETWNASVKIAQRFHEGLKVVDERFVPRRSMHWDQADTAIGTNVFVAPYDLLPFSANSSVGWLIAGPTYGTGLGSCRSIAFIPAVVSYP